MLCETSLYHQQATESLNATAAGTSAVPVDAPGAKPCCELVAHGTGESVPQASTAAALQGIPMTSLCPTSVSSAWYDLGVRQMPYSNAYGISDAMSIAADAKPLQPYKHLGD